MLKIRNRKSLCGLLITATTLVGLGTAEAQMTRLPPGPVVSPGTNPYANAVPPTQISGMRVVADRAVNSISSSPAMRQIQAAKQAEKRGDRDVAAKLYGEALASFPNDRNALIHFARFKHRSGQLDSAIVTYQQCLKFYPNDATAQNDIGLCYSRKGDIAKAVQHVENAVRCNPSSKRYRNNLATLCIEAQQTDRALAILCEVHGKAVGNYNLGYLLSKRDRNAEAVNYLQQALVLDPSLSPASQLLAVVAESDIGSESPMVASNDSGNIERQSAVSSTPGNNPSSAMYYEEQSGRADPPEVGAFPIPGMTR